VKRSNASPVVRLATCGSLLALAVIHCSGASQTADVGPEEGGLSPIDAGGADDHGSTSSSGANGASSGSAGDGGSDAGPGGTGSSSGGSGGSGSGSSGSSGSGSSGSSGSGSSDSSGSSSGGSSSGSSSSGSSGSSSGGGTDGGSRDGGATGLVLTPPMGWNSWNNFGCNVSASLIEKMADALVTTGMRDVGYTFVNIDDCWQVSRASDGTIRPSSGFPDGMKAVADYVHAKGLKFGIYTDAGSATCEGRPGSQGYETQDAQTYAEWCVDYVKEDWCNATGLDPKTQYGIMHDALIATGRPIVFSICDWGVSSPWTWGPQTGNLWRTTYDIKDNWAAMLSNLDQSSQYAAAASPGHWNDPDLLEVGIGGMSDEEYRSHFSLWAIMAAPLIAGNDLTTMSDSTKGILTNTEVIAVDQDSAGNQGTKIADDNFGHEVWAKPLASGAKAVVLFNRSSAPAAITVNWSDVGLTGNALVRDLWQHQDMGTFGRSYSTMPIPSHGVAMLVLTPK
jgi:alpha-galactosidase